MIIQILTEKQFRYKFWTTDTLTMVIAFFAYKEIYTLITNWC